MKATYVHWLKGLMCVYLYIVNIFIRFFMRPLRKLRIIVNEEQDNIGLLKTVIEMPVPFSSSFKSQFTDLYLWETAFDSSRWRYFSCSCAVFAEFLQHAMNMLLLLHVYRWVFWSVQQHLRRLYCDLDLYILPFLEVSVFIMNSRAWHWASHFAGTA